MICTTCKKEKGSECFGMTNTGGYTYPRSECKECAAKKQAQWRRDNPEERKRQDREYYERHRDEMLKYQKERRKNNPMMHPAQNILHRAVKAGKIIRPSKCSMCDRKTSVVGHHPDYSEPLSVIWVCKPCHGKIHKSGVT